MPGVALELSPGEFKAALLAIREESDDRLRIAIFPTWYEKGKKGESFETFLNRLGLGARKTPATKHKGAKPTQEQLAAIYAKAEQIREKINGARQ